MALPNTAITFMYIASWPCLIQLGAFMRKSGIALWSFPMQLRLIIPYWACYPLPGISLPCTHVFTYASHHLPSILLPAYLIICAFYYLCISSPAHLIICATYHLHISLFATLIICASYYQPNMSLQQAFHPSRTYYPLLRIHSII